MFKLFSIFTFSSIVALSGALVPGPLLTYTIIKTLETRNKGYLTGFKVIAGHALIEAGIIVGILFGLSLILTNRIVVITIGVSGGLFLLYMGIDIIYKVKNKKFSNPFEKTDNTNTSNNPSITKLSNPIIGGALISMSNPYWWIWWATIGFGFMIQYNITLQNWKGLLSFYTGHESGDLLWYATVSTLIFIGKKRINQKLYTIMLIICSIIISGFGAFLIIKVLTNPI